VGGKTERIKAGDALYLLPGDIYRLLPCKEDFSLYNLFFDFIDDRPIKENNRNACVFMKYYDTELCLPRIKFEDAAVLNKSGIFRNFSIKKILSTLIYKDLSDEFYCFYGRAMIFSFIADMLTAARENEKECLVTQRILEYIRLNPEKDLSGDTLSKTFSYHKNHINKLVKRETGRSLSEYIRYSKIEYAKTIIFEEGCSLSEISMRLGYFDYSHFYKAFYKEVGITPTEYMKIFDLY
jgi:AraC-like DNA-binding protein